jgi:hypothetical protein
MRVRPANPPIPTPTIAIDIAPGIELVRLWPESRGPKAANGFILCYRIDAGSHDAFPGDVRFRCRRDQILELLLHLQEVLKKSLRVVPKFSRNLMANLPNTTQCVGDFSGHRAFLRPYRFWPSLPRGLALLRVEYRLQPMKSLRIEIDDDLAGRLERIAPARSRRRSELIRAAILKALWDAEEQAVAEAYARQPDSLEVAFDPAVWEGRRAPGKR